VPVALAVMLGGALGALARYGLDSLIEHRAFSVFPWSTFLINVSGCFVAGAVVAALVDRHHLPLHSESGSWSAFSAPTRRSRPSSRRPSTSRAHDYFVATVNAVGSVGAGIAAVVAGTAAGKLF
jgi:CrcB protein